MMLLKSPLVALLLALVGTARVGQAQDQKTLLEFGLPRQTYYSDLVILMSELYNPSNCGGSYQLLFSNYTFNNLVSITTTIVCDGQNFTIFGSGNGLDVKFPVDANNYTGIELDTLQACGRTDGCFNVTYTGTYPGLPTYVGCTAFAQRSAGQTPTACTSCDACTTGETHIKMTINCDNVDSTYSTTSDCTAPFTSNSSVMGVTAAQGGGGTSAAYLPFQGAAASLTLLVASLFVWLL